MIKAIKGLLQATKGLAPLVKSTGKNVANAFKSAASSTRTGGGAKIAKGIFDVAKDGTRVYNPNRDVMVMAGRKAFGAASAIGSVASKIGRGTYNIAKAVTPGRRVRAAGLNSLMTLGAVSMVGLSIMQGGMSTAREIVHERYMQDYTQSRSVLQNTRIGQASRNSSMLNYGNTQGLTLALSKTRHGKYR